VNANPSPSRAFRVTHAGIGVVAVVLEVSAIVVE
jgi:hypothetical protein